MVSRGPEGRTWYLGARRGENGIKAPGGADMESMGQEAADMESRGQEGRTWY